MLGVLPSFLARLLFYVNGQASGFWRYLLQDAVLALCGWVPGVVGLMIRATAYRLILHTDGFVLVEPGVRLRHAGNIRLGRGVLLSSGVYIHACAQGVEVGDDSVLMRGVELHTFNFRDLPHAFVRIGRRCIVGSRVVIRGQGGVSIGDDVVIEPGAQLIAAQHNFGDTSRPVSDQYITATGIAVGDGVLIGARAIVLDGVCVGSGAVIGVGAVVTRDVPSRCYAAGVPASVVRRFPASEDDPAPQRYAAAG